MGVDAVDVYWVMRVVGRMERVLGLGARSRFGGMSGRWEIGRVHSGLAFSFDWMDSKRETQRFDAQDDVRADT